MNRLRQHLLARPILPIDLRTLRRLLPGERGLAPDGQDADSDPSVQEEDDV